LDMISPASATVVGWKCLKQSCSSLFADKLSML
jgi:hypothetical protein